ncbi:hypothetical protein HHI36_005019 [Cryptolaemus montrouzieri]|uniref:Uncharacterized protein n=1 Tax=Cryptolaemus montrouzieri TaxID=559131 RepID=A0ABD2NTB9_9CUCU
MLSNCEKMNTGLESLNIKKRPEKIQSSENNKNFKCKDISKSLFAKSEFRKMNKTFEGIIGKKEIRNEFQICRSFQECRKNNMQLDESKRLVSTSIQSLSFFEMHNKSSFLEPNQYMESDSKLNLSDESEYLEFSSRGIKPIRNTWQHFIQNLNDVDKDEQFFKLWEDSIEAPLLGTENIQQLEIDSQQNYLHTEDSDFSSRELNPEISLLPLIMRIVYQSLEILNYL